jgi:hypothetical protein
VFEKPATGWDAAMETARITPLYGIPYDEFGIAIAIGSAGALVVGAPGVDGSNPDGEEGAAYVYGAVLTPWSGPRISVPANLFVPATGPSGAVVGFEATATDDADGTVPVSCTPASGSLFPMGADRGHVRRDGLGG